MTPNYDGIILRFDMPYWVKVGTTFSRASGASEAELIQTVITPKF
jgi:hypothetical protein